MSTSKMIWWLYTTPSDTMDVLYDENLDDMVMYLEEACDRILLANDETKLTASEQGWRGSLLALRTYACLACVELRHKRLVDLPSDMFWRFANPGKAQRHEGVKFSMPPWYEDEDVIKSHWSAGLRHKAIISDIVTPYKGVDEYWPILWPVVLPDGGYELRINKPEKEALLIDDLWLPDDVRARVVNL